MPGLREQHGQVLIQQISEQKIKISKANQRKRLPKEDKALLLAKAIKKRLLLKQKQHFWFTLKFLRAISYQNPHLKTFKQIKLYCEAILLKKQQKSALVSCISQDRLSLTRFRF